MTFNQTTGKTQQRRSKNRRSQLGNNRKQAFINQFKYDSNMSNDLQPTKFRQTNSINKQQSGYSLPWIRSQKYTQTAEQSPMGTKQQNHYFDLSIIQQKDTLKKRQLSKSQKKQQKSQSTICVNKQSFHPWYGRINKKQQNIILNYLNSKVQLQKPKHKKRKRMQIANQERQSGFKQFIVIPKSQIVLYNNSISAQTKLKLDENNSEYKKASNKSQLDYLKNNPRQMSMLIQQKSALQKQKRVIEQIKNKVQQIQRYRHSTETIKKQEQSIPSDRNQEPQIIFLKTQMNVPMTQPQTNKYRQNGKWKQMQRSKLLRKVKDKSKLNQIIKPRNANSYHERKCNSTFFQEDTYTLNRKQVQKISALQTIKVETECQDNYKNITSKLRKFAQNERDLKRNNKRIIYLQKSRKARDSLKHTQRRANQSDTESKMSNYKYIHSKTECNKLGGRLDSPLRIPDKQFLKLSTYYAQLGAMRHSEKSPRGLNTKALIKLHRLPMQDQLLQFIHTYIPESSRISVPKLMQNQSFKILLQQGEQLYFGLVDQTKRKSGLGVTIKDGYLFQGMYKDGFKVQGMEVTQTGKYIGGFKDNRRQGNGQFFYKNGQYYQGQWRKSKKHGNGMWSATNGDHYIGQWVEGKVQGQGIHTTLNGQHYEGSFRNFLKQGWGKQDLPNGDVYEGQFSEGKPHGKGTYRWRQGGFYQGEFVRGLRHNSGVLQDFAGNLYKGHFSNQKAQGFCQINFLNHDFYEGIVENGLFNGRGTLKLHPQKLIWTGYWIKDQFVEQIS